MVACGTQETTNDVPVSTETIEATVESDENSEAVSETEQATEAPVDEVVETVDETVESESSEATSETESDEVASTPDSEAVESEASEPETSEPEFTVTEVSKTLYAIQSVNVRSGPSTDYDKIGSLSTNQEITVNGVCDQTGWFRFDLNGTVAFVSNRYVSDEKVEKPAASETPSNGGNSTAGTGSVASGAFNEADYYPYQIINKGGTNVYYVMGIDPDANEAASYQCDAIVSKNLGVELGYHGGGSYYWFPTHYNPSSDPNEVRGLFFPYYTESNGHYLGQPADTREN